MIETYLLLSFIAGAPKIDVYPNLQDACIALEGVSAKGEAHIYKETVDRRDTFTITEGTCKPLKQFVVPK